MRTPATPYVRLIDFVYHSTLGLGVINKKRDLPHAFAPMASASVFERIGTYMRQPGPESGPGLQVKQLE